MKVKYIKTKDNKIIVFSALQDHSEFAHFEPVSAGFISFGIDKNRNPDCTCYGKSVSLKLSSMQDDTLLAKRQILEYDEFLMG